MGFSSVVFIFHKDIISYILCSYEVQINLVILDVKRMSTFKVILFYTFRDMTMSVASNATAYDDDKLYNYNTYLIKRNSIVFVYMTIVILMGICGNAVSFIFYGFRSKKESVTHFLIAALALNDLLSSLTSINIVLLYCFYVTIKNETFCMLCFFFGHVFVIISVCMLLLIGLQRYIRICSTDSRFQFTKLRVKVLITLIVIFSVSICARSFILGGVHKIQHIINGNETIHVYTCSFTRDEGLKDTVFAFKIIDCVVFIFTNFSLIVLYTLIIRKIRRVGNAWTMSRTGRNYDTGEMPVVCASKDKKGTRAMTKADESCRVKSTVIKSNSDVNINIMLLGTTIASIISFLPYFCLELFDGSTYSFVYTPLQHLAHRSWMLNSSINPYVMAIFNRDLRKFVKSHLCTRCSLQRS